MSAAASSLEPGSLPFSWAETPGEQGTPFRVHAYNPDFFILRQSGRTHFEKPFLYLLIGAERALLVDTGAPGVDVAGEVRSILARWAGSRPAGMPLPELVVAHTHGHSDHVAGDPQFEGNARTRLVGTSVEAVSAFYGIRRWPEDRGFFDLGARPLDVIPVPGHEPSSVAIYDRRTGVLLSGDVLYPGRLYVRDAGAFRDSIARLVHFTAGRPVAHFLGAHIENSRTPFVDYPEGTVSQPDEHPLELGRAHLLELEQALAAMAPAIDRLVLRDFTIWPV